MRQKVPPMWTWVRIGDVLAEPLINGRSVPTDGDGFPVLRLTALRNGRIDLSERKGGAWSRAEAERFLVRSGDFLVARGNGSRSLVGRGGVVADSADEIAFPDTLIRIRVDADAMYLPYLRYVWDSAGVRQQIESAARTTAGIYKINQQDLNAVEIPLPPLAEQRRIVATIDEHLSDLDAAVAALERVRANLKRYEASILQAAVRGELASEVEPIGIEGQPSGLWPLPAAWRWVMVQDVGDVLLGRQRAPQYLTGRYSRPYLRVANVGDDFVDLSDVKEMDFDETHLRKYRLLPGDILVSEGQSTELVGQSAIYRGGIENLCFQKTLHRFRARPEFVTPEFAQIAFRAFVKNGVFQKHASLTVNIAHLTLERFKAVPFPLPPLFEQQQIVAAVDQQLAAARRTRTEVRAQLQRGRAFRQALLRRAFEGKLVPQDPADEPASVLLDRIRAERAAAPTPARRASRAHSAR